MKTKNMTTLHLRKSNMPFDFPKSLIRIRTLPNFQLPQNTTRIFFLAVVTLLLLLTQSITLAGSATWDSSSSTDWNTNTNWTPATGYPGTTASDTATFNNLSSVTSLFISANPANAVSAITFTASETHAFTITINDNIDLHLSGAGITNNSGITQNFDVGTPTGTGGFLFFDGSSTAGSSTHYTVGEAGAIFFNDTVGTNATAGSATFDVLGGAASNFFGGAVDFEGTGSTAGTATFTNHAGTNNGGGGFTEFDSTATADHATITNNANSIFGAWGLTIFTTNATADHASITNNGGTGSGADGAQTDFFGSSTAGSSTITNNPGTVSGATGGVTDFTASSTAGSATITSNGGTIAGAGGGETLFENTSTASGATLIANGGSGGGGGGFIVFIGSSTGSDVNGAARVELFGNGYLDIHLHNAPGVTIGSLEGSGNAFLGNRNLTVGSNNMSTTFSGVIQDGAPGGGGLTGGSLTKTGTGTFTLSGANTYTGATTISGGTLQLGNGGTTGTLSTSSTVTNNANFTINRSNAVVQGTDFSGSAITGTGSFTKAGSGTTTLNAANSYMGATTVNAGTLLINGDQSLATGAVTVNNTGTTLGGTGTIGGTVTVNSGANLSPGNSPGILNTGSVTLNSGSNFLIDINGPTVGTQYDQLNVTGTVTLTGSNVVLTIGGTLTVGQQFIIINNDLSDAVVGMFAQGGSVSSGGDTFSIDYAGGSGNDVVLTATAVAVPEPTTWVAGALAVAFVAYAQRRRLTQMLRRA
jgi:fibronectin-binding autotransporter adhesin